MDGKAQPVHEDYPEAGWFMMRLVKQGPMVPVSIELVQELDDGGELMADEVLRCTVNGLPADPVRTWLMCCRRPIDPKEYHWHIEQMLLGRKPDPRKPINLMKPKGPQL